VRLSSGNDIIADDNLPGVRSSPPPRNQQFSTIRHRPGAHKKKLAVAVYNHYKLIEIQKQPRGQRRRAQVEHPARGPTGTGKTLLAQTLAKLLSYRSRSWTPPRHEAGYVGEDVENIIPAAAGAGGASRSASRVIYIDEVDKICRKDENPRSPATCRVKASSRPERSSKARWPTCRPAGASNRTRSSSRSIPPTSCSSGGAPVGLDKGIDRRVAEDTPVQGRREVGEQA
jgi:ATP-dependent Clp protease ATP-binding subunit ClpX